jgi:hypothetical protein
MLMVRTTLKALSLAATLVVCAHVVGAGRATLAASPPLFCNYYTDTPGVPAQLYTCPLPTPPLVGHTWITYQALEPHEFLYHHHRRYYSYHPDAAYNVTTVRYHHSLLKH